MTRSLLLLLATLLVADSSLAQTTRRPLSRGDVQGVELALEGPLVAPRGTTLTWLVTAYDVLGVDRLRPSPGARIVLTSSTSPGEPVVELEADDRGRATLALPLPADAPPMVGVTVSIHSRRGVQRRFDLSVRTRVDRELRVHLAPPAVVVDERPSPVVAVGRLTDTRGVGLAGEPIEVSLFDGRGPLGAPRAVTTEVGGFFVARFEPRVAPTGSLRVEALAPSDEPNDRVRASAAAALRTVSPAEVLVQIAPAERVVRPEAAVPVEVVVRRADGMPLAGAQVAVGGRVPGFAPGMENEPEPGVEITDARGRARLSWEAPRLGQPYRDVNVTIAAAHPAHGMGVGHAQVRVARVAHQAALSVEGGALTPELGGKLFVRMATIDGRPAAGVPVTVVGPRLGEHTGRSGDGGVAVFDVDLTDAEDDRCGGAASASLTLRFDQTEMPLCVPVEVDGAARVAADPLAAAGGTLELTLERPRRAARLPIAVQVDGAFHAGVVAEPGQTTVSLPIPEDARGELVVRARPLVDGREVVGGTAMVWVASRAEPLAAGRLSAEPSPEDRSRIAVTVGSPAVVVALPLEVRDEWQASLANPWAELRGAGSADAIAALLATRATADVAAPSVYRARCEGRGACVVPRPAPADPTAQGLLRDPWRASDRFVEGRLALVFRALEQRVAAAVPGNLDTVSHEERGRRVLDDHVIASLPEGMLGGEGATGLGGEPLTLAQLQRIDAGFGFDAIAGRITRERLFRLLLVLRQFVNQSGLDLPWARPGDPTLWLRQIVGHYASGQRVDARDLVDGWGRPFELRPVARARFQQLQPVAGYELVSAGPDGRVGNGDDLVDPTARVLRAGSLYARAVGEEALLARLAGVELGRASLDMAAAIHGQGAPPIRAPETGRAQVELGSLPPLLAIPPAPLALRRPAIPAASAAGVGTRIELAVGDEPRTWGVVAWTVDAAGRERLLGDVVAAGAPAFVTPELSRDLRPEVGPERLRMDEPLTWPLRVVNATEEPLRLALETEGWGVRLEVPDELVVDPAAGVRLDVGFQAQDTGRARWALRSGAITLARGALTIDRGLHPLRRVATGLAMDRWHGAMGDLDGAQHARSRVVLLGRGGLGADPDLAEARRGEAALLGWHAAMVGRPLDPDLAARVERAAGSGGVSPALSRAATAVALATTLDPEDDRARELVRRLADSVANGAALHEGASDEQVAELAALVAVLATSGVSPRDEPVWPLAEDERIIMPPRPHDGLSRFVEQARVVLRRVLAERPDRPALQARAAAALLLVDAGDGHGRAMVEGLRESDALRAMGLRGEDAADSFQGTLALALAAHQVGDDALAERMARGAANHAGFAARGRGAALFWWLALDAYGVLGARAPESVTVRVDGERHTVALRDGVGVLDLGEVAMDDVVVESEHPVFARAETLYGRALGARDEGPLAVSLAGRAGAVGAPAGFEVQVVASAEVGTPVVDIQLPASAIVDALLLRSVQASSAVQRVEAREPGFLRVHLIPMREGQALTFALPLVRIAASPVRGLGMVAYPATRPAAMSVVAPRTLD
mgnify:CR=1 FL=1